MTFKEIQELIKLVNKANLTEFKVKNGEFELAIRTENYTKTGKTVVAPMQTAMAPMAMAPAAISEEASAPAASEAKSEKSGSGGSEPDTSNLLEIKSPIVGTFYRSASPDKPPYIKIGDTVDAGSVVCIVEAMKLFNEIESEVSGKIVKVMIEDAQPVQYDQVLFLVDPKG